MRVLVSLGLAAFFVAAGACRSPSQNQGGACERDADCNNPDKPVCERSSGTCVACVLDENCGCHEVCSDQICVPLGATSLETRANAHGNWIGLPGQSNYRYQDSCANDEDCEFGQICNLLTGGCLDAADYTVSCQSGPDCPDGPAGELLECEPSTRRCLPAATCTTDNNCCGVTSTHEPFLGFACDTATSMCRAPADECAVPVSVSSTCPFEADYGDSGNQCGAGEFCNTLGRCVECGCDEDCGSASLKCYSDQTCRPIDFCTSPNECNQPSESCDTQATSTGGLCRPRCDNDAACEDNQYCHPEDDVCRPRSELPCLADSYDALGNESAEAAFSNNASLPVPDVGQSISVPDLSLCAGDSDYYTIALQRADKIIIRGESLTSLAAEIVAYSTDRTTTLGQGVISDFLPSPLEFTANFDGLYYIQVRRLASAARGTYGLNITRELGEACEDPAEDAMTNNTAAEATMLNNPAPVDCDTTATTVTCSDGVFTMCQGDVDYYIAEVEAGADFAFEVSEFASNLNLDVYGPFASAAEALVDDARLLGSSSGAFSSLERVSRTARSSAFYLARVTLIGEATPYDLDFTISPAVVSCSEDIYDSDVGATAGTGLLPAFVDDPDGLNDLGASASTIALHEGTNLAAGVTEVEDATGEGLTLCRGDVDWFRLGVDSEGQLVDIPAGRRLVIEVIVAPSSPTSIFSLAVGNSTGSVPLVPSSSEPRKVRVPFTNGQPYFVRVTGGTAANTLVDYKLRITHELPPECANDGFGDISDDDRNDAPATALGLSDPGTSPGVATYAPGDLTLCGEDSDWYELTVPAGAELIARAYYNFMEAELGLAMYSDAVAAIATPTTGRITTGLLASSEHNDRGFQRVRFAPTSTTVFLQVYNRTGWPLQDYSLDVELLSTTTCGPDDFEPNNSAAQAAPFPLELQPYKRGQEFGVVDALTVCSSTSGNDDYFSFEAGPGDRIRLRAYTDYLNEGDLDMSFLAPVNSPSGTTWLGGDTDTESIAEIDVTLSSSAFIGNYIARVYPFSASGSLYALEVLINRACADDDLEPSTLASPVALDSSWPLELPDLVLCRNEDWYEITVDDSGGPVDLSICADFVHASGDIDIALFDSLPSSTTASSDLDSMPAYERSATKSNTEVLEMVGIPGGVYYLRVSLDPRDRVNTSYGLRIGSPGCP